MKINWIKYEPLYVKKHFAGSPRVLSYIFWLIWENNLHHPWASRRLLLSLLGTHVGVFSIKHLLSSNGPLFSFQWSPRFHDPVYLAGSQFQVSLQHSKAIFKFSKGSSHGKSFCSSLPYRWKQSTLYMQQNNSNYFLKRCLGNRPHGETGAHRNAADAAWGRSLKATLGPLLLLGVGGNTAPGIKCASKMPKSSRMIQSAELANNAQAKKAYCWREDAEEPSEMTSGCHTGLARYASCKHEELLEVSY